MVKVFIFCITVHRVHSTDEDGYIYKHLSPLAVDSIEQAPGYRFDREIQEIYLSRDLLSLFLGAKLQDIQLPVPQVVPPPQPPAPNVNEEVLKVLQTTHDATVNMLRTQDIDACKVDKERDAASILAHIRPQDVKCSYCDRVCKTSQKLKAHIRSHHLKSAAYRCPVCNKSFGAPYALNQHKKSHEEGGRKFLCAVCGKGFVSKSQVNEHSKRHLQRRVTCAHCSKSVADNGTLQSHLRICSKRPQLQQDLPQTEEQARPCKCHHCFCHYIHKKDLMHHL